MCMCCVLTGDDSLEGDTRVFIVLAIKIKRIRLFAGLAEMNKISYFVGLSHFGATDSRCSEDRFFSQSQYFAKKSFFTK